MPLGWYTHYTEVLRIQTSDRVFGSVVSLGILVGLLGNGSAICYFWLRRKKTIHDLLYLAITVVDFLTVSSSFALAVSLFSNREPILFKNHVFCTVWSSVIIFTSRMSMFLAMIICITRTLAMKYPNRPIKRAWVVGIFVGYAVYMFVFYLVYLPQGWHFSEYETHLSFCIIKLLRADDSILVPATAKYFGLVSYFIEFSLPSVVTFVCFIVGVRFLMTRPTSTNASERKFRRVSITITLFTAVFLACNIPCFFILVWNVLASITPVPSPVKVFVNDQEILTVGGYYTEILLQFFPVFLNAAINPILYLSRMRQYQNRIRHFVQNYSGSWNQTSARGNDSLPGS